MRPTFVTDLTHFLTEDGAIAPMPAPARRLADFLTGLVASVASPPAEPFPLQKMACRRRPGRKPCAGRIEADVDPETDDIVWCCPVCGDNGVISNWQGSFWDCSGDAQGRFRA